jgi:zona occludens toxin
MLYFVTGLPGASKTLNTIKMVRESDEFHNRPVFVNHIDDLNVPGWTNINDDEAKQWFDFPEGSVIIVDEAYRLFPNTKRGATLPPHYERLAEIRHFGITMLLITQSASDVDVFVRRKAGRHYHYERFYGSKMVARLDFRLTSGAIMETDKPAARQLATVSRFAIDKKYFKFYKSAEVHTVKQNIPINRFISMFVGLFLAIGGITYAFNLFSPDEKQNVLTDNSLQQENNKQQTDLIEDNPKKKQTTEFDYNPRVAGLPWTAPVYDSINVVKSIPLPKACVIFHQTKRCVCYTDQSTPVDIQDDMCRKIAIQGFFDHTREVRDTRAPRDVSEARAYVSDMPPPRPYIAQQSSSTRPTITPENKLSVPPPVSYR